MAFLMYTKSNSSVKRILLEARRINLRLGHLFSDDCAMSSCEKKGLVLGVYDGDCDQPVFTKAAQKFNDHIGGKLYDLVKASGPDLINEGNAKIFTNLCNDFWVVSIAGLGKMKRGYDEIEAIDEGLEAVRVASAIGSLKAKRNGATRIFVEGMGYPEQAAEGATLALWRYQENKSREHWKPIPTVEMYDECDTDCFQRGLFKAESQNFARRLCDTPANQMTPLHFAQETVNELCPCGIKVLVHDKHWIENARMNAFLTVARGSCEPPVFLEISYCGGPTDQKPILLVGKGVTFDSGGLCLKSCDYLERFRADMTGAAAIVATIRAAAALSLPINLEACIPLCENMPSGMAMKCGDVVTALNGKTIMISNTAHEGRVILADALCYGQQIHNPRLVIDVASLTTGIRASLGSAACGVFCNSQTMWSQVRKAGVITGDRVWRMPLWKFFTKRVTRYKTHDVNNMGTGHGAPCLAAAFLQEFIECVDWIHFDTGGVGFKSEHKFYPYLYKGRMTGRPTRTLIQLLYQLACPSEGQRDFKS
ncbi:hypothetical protein HHI36_020966 [Cryptolaemus montrouzieri]|uniref:Cytosol aminopeptidase n=1 Tax=Cryptolaemus montrouzieri TaxID=559131 RepID=A0ABD2NCP0_9CUCU